MTEYRTARGLQFISQDKVTWIDSGAPVKMLGTIHTNDGPLFTISAKNGSWYTLAAYRDLEEIPECVHVTLDKWAEGRTRYACRDCGERLTVS